MLRPLIISLVCLALAAIPGVALFRPGHQGGLIQQHPIVPDALKSSDPGAGGVEDPAAAAATALPPPPVRRCAQLAMEPSPFMRSCEHLEEVCVDQVRRGLRLLCTPSDPFGGRPPGWPRLSVEAAGRHGSCTPHTLVRRCCFHGCPTPAPSIATAGSNHCVLSKVLEGGRQAAQAAAFQAAGRVLPAIPGLGECTDPR